MKTNMTDFKITKTVGRKVTDSHQATSVNWASQTSIGNRTTVVKTTIQINSSKTIFKK